MKNLKKQSKYLFVGLFFAISSMFAQDVTTVTALDGNYSDNLDLEAVASVFGDAKDLADFENKLNDPATKISNLDLNEDNQVDYLRVVETAENNTHVIAIQAVIGDDLYQDVATLEVEKDVHGVSQVQVVGDVYLYGSNYIIEPVYVVQPVVFKIFWRSQYRPYRSIYRWGYYPKHFRVWHPFKPNLYRRNVHVHVNVRHKYKRTTIRRSKRAIVIHSKTRRVGAVKRYPRRSYSVAKRNVKKSHKVKKNKVKAGKKRKVNSRR